MSTEDRLSQPVRRAAERTGDDAVLCRNPRPNERRVIRRLSAGAANPKHPPIFLAVTVLQTSWRCVYGHQACAAGFRLPVVCILRLVQTTKQLLDDGLESVEPGPDNN